MDKLIDYIAYFVAMDRDHISALEHAFKYDSYEKNEFLLQPDQPCDKMFFIYSGACRSYYLQDGKDVTSWIYDANNFITNWSSFYTQSPSTEYIQSSCKTEVLYITFDNLQKLYRDYSKISEFGRIFAEQHIAFLDFINKEFIFSTAKQRYDHLLTLYPHITQYANLGHIASLLGITQETLSRLRKKK